jgi:PAS domain S-box-containing protein
VLEVDRTRTGAEACSVLLRFIVEECGLPRAAVVVMGSDRELHGLRQVEPEGAVERVAADADTVGPALRRALRAPVAGVVRADTASEPWLQGFRSCLIFPLAGFDGVATGAVIGDGEGFEGNVAEIAETLAECGPAVSRVVELEDLGLKYRHAKRGQKLLAFMVHSLPDPVLLTDEYNRIVISNSRADNLFVSRPEDTEGRRRAVGLNNLFFTSHLTEALVGGGQSRNMSELDLTDPVYGSDLSFDVLTFPIQHDPDLQAARITVLRDITDLKKALRELEERITQARDQEHRAVRQSARLQAIIENVGKPILVTDQRSNIVLLNPDAEQLLEAPRSGRAPREWTNAARDNHAQLTGILSEFLLHGAARQSRRVELSDPRTREARPVDVVSSIINDARGEVSAVVSVLRDLRPVVVNERLARELRELNEKLEIRVKDAVAELEERNAELREQTRIVERASRSKSEFLASVSHELRTPINAILGYTALIQERIYGELSDDQDRALMKVERASKHLLSLISDILDLSTIEAGRLPMALDEFSGAELVAGIAETIAPMARDAGLEFHQDASGAEDIHFRTDRTRLQQILFNLLTNSVKYTDEGTVTFRMALGVDGFVRFEVEDTGIGIDPEEIDAVFESFTQALRTREAHRGGAGLGLAISLRLSEMMGGTLDVESTVGTGSIFTLLIPAEVPTVRAPRGGIPEHSL